MSRHKQQRPTTNFKWWRRYLLHLATTLLINATRNTRQRQTRKNKSKKKANRK